jgi:predicted phage terminase large subunit-like protein
LPKEAAWLPEYLHELTAFPKGKHDDQVDSTAQMLD